MRLRSLLVGKAAAAVGLAVLFAGLVGPLAAETKNYYFPEVRIKIDIREDGSFTVDEFRTYEFQGRFSWANLWIPLRLDRKGYRYDAALEDFTVSDEQGAPLRLETGVENGTFQAKWYYSARNERRTFHIHYVVKGGVISYPEVTELYWQPIGSECEKPTREVSIEVALPRDVPSRDDLLVYGHGPLSGWAEIMDLRTARFTATNVPSRQSVEIRMIWPPGLVNGVPGTGRTRASIKAEEARFVQDTIVRVQRSAEDRARRRRLVGIIGLAWVAWLIVGPLIWLAIYLRAWGEVGRDYRFEGMPEYYREPPSDLPPALVEVLLHQAGYGYPTPRSFTATLFDLARRGYVELEDRPTEKRGLFGSKETVTTVATLKKNIDADRDLLAYERDYLKLFFEGAPAWSPSWSGRTEPQVDLEDFKRYLKKKPLEFQKWFKDWTSKVKEEAKKRGFIEPQSLKARNIFLAVSLPIAILVFNPVLLIMILVLTPFLKRRAMPWAEENERWKGLRRFLHDFSDFKEVPPEAYKLWERYLVFGIVFGSAKKILKMLPVILPDNRAAAPAWYYGAGGSRWLGSGGGIENMIKGIESLSSSIQQASASAAHYSSGGGGGFSGGGGGGGGGGGAGAG